MSLFSSGVHGALEVVIRGEVITEEAVTLGEGCGRCCSCRKSSGDVLGQGDMGGEVSIYLLPMSVILARQRWGVSVHVPPLARWLWDQSGSAPSTAELHRVHSTVPLPACSAQTTPTAGVELCFFFFFLFTSHKMELDPCYRGNQQP